MSGIKRHIGVGSQGLPHFIATATAGVTDRQGALDGMENHQQALGGAQAALVAGGHTGKPFAQEVTRLLGAEVTVAKRNELHTFAVTPKRRVVERSFAWLGKGRR